MGRLLGSHDESTQIDRPDLNKCPDCGCFFSQDNCPLCGKVCPEGMKAGNRKAIKKKKKSSNGTGRVTFIEWYHRWWFILLMMIFAPIIGIILFATSPYKKWVKILVIVLAVVYTLLTSFGLGGRILNLFDNPVNTSLSRDEYIEKCDNVSAEDYFRNTEKYDGEFVSTTIIIKEKIVDYDEYYSNGKYPVYYICMDGKGGTFELMIRDCLQGDDTQNFMIGDTVTVYGEGAGNCTIYDMDYYAHEAPCIYVAYADVVK